ncbi:MAG: transglutaminaseTgpA domain-containing protein [Acidimicrobiia bacterium]
MDRRLGRIAGIVALGLVLARLVLRLLLGGPGIPPWPLILVASALLGGIVFWLLGQALPERPRLVVFLFGLGALLLLLRVTVPETLLAGVIPSAETWSPLSTEMSGALRLIRHGVAPVVPTTGVVGVLAVVMWFVGSLFAWGSTTGPVAALFLPLLTLYLQLAVSDRHPVGLTWTVVFIVVLGLGVTAMAMERRQAVGRARDPDGRAIPSHTPYLALILTAVVGLGALVITETAAGLVPSQGVLAWRGGGTGYGLGGSGVAFNRLVDLKQRIISRTNQVLFRATLGPDSPPGDRIYWRMETLDEFDGSAWRRSNVNSQAYDPNRGVPASDDLYLGTSHRVLHQVQIDNLRGEGVLPTAGVPLQVHELSVGNSAIPPSSLLVLEDSALVAPSGLQRGATYQAVASHPDIDADLGSLATGPDGALSPLFAAAAAVGNFEATPGGPPVETATPAGLARYTQLPDDIPATLTDIAREQTAGASTNFERAWLLQHWFRDSGDFQYSTDVSTGHDSLDLEDWLTDDTSSNHRIGYCEQFAATMAILGRTLGIPSRVVWGFTPGQVEPQAEGPDVVVVRDTNAHAWVEMWMDGFGWVSFDPTPRGAFQPPSPTASFDPTRFLPDPGDLGTVTAPTVPGGAEGPNAFVDEPPISGTLERTRWWLLLVPALAIALAAVPLAKSVRRRRRLARLRRGDITAAWEEIVDRLTDLGEPVPPAKTPMELARDTDIALLSLAVGYSAAVYGGRIGNGKESDLLDIEGWLHTKYQGGRRIRARISPRSLRGRVD